MTSRLIVFHVIVCIAVMSFVSDCCARDKVKRSKQKLLHIAITSSATARESLVCREVAALACALAGPQQLDYILFKNRKYNVGKPLVVGTGVCGECLATCQQADCQTGE